MNYYIYNKDCIQGSTELINNKSIDLVICDPPFGIGESSFSKHYNRNNDKIIPGYVEAPEDYLDWTILWIEQAKRILKDNGSLFIISGHSSLYDIMTAARINKLFEINHIIWKYNFGVNTKKKFVTSHYHILYYKKDKKSKNTFNLYGRYSYYDKDIKGRSLLYSDIEDVWEINREYDIDKTKNANKLPNELIKKIIEYASNKDDVVCDFFLGNFTTAYVSLKMGRKIIGFEKNKNAYDYHIEKIKDIKYGSDISENKNKLYPQNQGKKIDSETLCRIEDLCRKYNSEGMSKKQICNKISEDTERGYFSIYNIIKKYGFLE